MLLYIDLHIILLRPVQARTRLILEAVLKFGAETSVDTSAEFAPTGGAASAGFRHDQCVK
jgi:hypothetical protein